MNCFGGACTSWVTDGVEMLDRPNWEIKNWVDNDPEKRVAQVNSIFVNRPPWDKRIVEEELYNKKYELRSYGEGSVRAFATLVSPTFEYNFNDLISGNSINCDARLFRVFSLYAGADFLLEDIFVEVVPKNHESKTFHAPFTLSYFAYIIMGPINIKPDPFVRDWFCSSSSDWIFSFSYGFATDAELYPVKNPHPSYPIADKADNTFSWQTLRSKRSVRCLHSFIECKDARDRPYHFDHKVGNYWYDHIYTPLIVELSKG